MRNKMKLLTIKDKLFQLSSVQFISIYLMFVFISKQTYNGKKFKVFVTTFIELIKKTGVFKCCYQPW